MASLSQLKRLATEGASNASKGFKRVESKGRLDEEDYDKLYSHPKKYKGFEVELTGQIFSEPEKDGDGTYIQFWADPENVEKTTLVAIDNADLKVKTDDYVKMKGIVNDEFEGENAFGERSRRQWSWLIV